MTHDFLIPGPVDVRTLDQLGAAVTGGFLLASLNGTRRGLERLSDDDMPGGALRFILGAVRAVAGAGERPTPVTIAAHVQRGALMPESNRSHFGVLLVDLTGPDVCPAGPGELERIPDLVNAAARRQIRVTAHQVLQALDESSDGDLAVVVPELGRDLWRAAQRVYVPEVTQ
ncbi:hypothetical protein ACTXLT_03135 [Brachybacterium alimentarium]|uniref:hypothetical protein n=1 Tax=Brachybacterium alimentarium TaxID=47845 RepID=UPI00403D7B41